MKRLSKQEQLERDSLAQAIDDAKTALESAVSEYNTKVSELWQPVENALTTYNGAVDDAQIFRDGIVGQMDDYIGERSEKWTEGDAGQSYQEWKDSWEGCSIEPIEIDSPEDIEIPDAEGADALRDLEVEPA